MDIISEEQERDKNGNIIKSKTEYFENKINSPKMDDVNKFIISLINKHNKKKRKP